MIKRSKPPKRWLSERKHWLSSSKTTNWELWKTWRTFWKLSCGIRKTCSGSIFHTTTSHSSKTSYSNSQNLKLYTSMETSSAIWNKLRNSRSSKTCRAWHSTAIQSNRSKATECMYLASCTRITTKIWGDLTRCSWPTASTIMSSSFRRDSSQAVSSDSRKWFLRIRNFHPSQKWRRTTRRIVHSDSNVRSVRMQIFHLRD